jgi:hypothetical protein
MCWTSCIRGISCCLWMLPAWCCRRLWVLTGRIWHCSPFACEFKPHKGAMRAEQSGCMTHLVDRSSEPSPHATGTCRYSAHGRSLFTTSPPRVHWSCDITNPPPLLSRSVELRATLNTRPVWVSEGEVSAALQLAARHQHVTLLHEALALQRFMGPYAVDRPPSVLFYHTRLEAHAACGQLHEAFAVLALITEHHPASEMVRPSSPSTTRPV